MRVSRIMMIGLMPSCLVSLPAFCDSLPDVVEQVRPAVVGIGTVLPERRPGAMLGTGFGIGNGRYVLTNVHVVSRPLDAEKRERFAIYVGRGPDADIRPCEVVALDRDHDLALLRIDGAPVKALPFGDSTRVREGEVYAFTGFPISNVLGLYPATNQAMVAAITPIAVPMEGSKDLQAEIVSRLRAQTFDVFQLDAVAYPGNSGSPLYSPIDGSVVGILNMVLVKQTRGLEGGPSGIAFAIPINNARGLLEKAFK